MNNVQENNERLIEKCIGGDIKAQFMLYKRYSKAMYNAAIRIVNNKILRIRY